MDQRLCDTPRVTGLIGYARISTVDQDLALQLDALDGAGCIRVFKDKASGKLDRRPQLDACLDFLREGDTLVVWKLDRLGRSIRHLIDTVTALEGRGVGFRSITEGFDTTTPGGKLIFHVLGALAEFERNLIVERTKAGLIAARARGRKGGRPRVLTPDKVATARQLVDAGELTMARIADIVGCSTATLYRSLADEAQKVAG